MGKKIYFIWLMVIVLLSCNPRTGGLLSVSSRPNILFIAVDDLRPETNAYGNMHMITPNMDKLASQGRLFLNHYANVPTCGPSRFSLLTGKYPQTRGQLSNAVFERVTAGKQKQLLPESMIETFRRNGYKTIGIGKISHAADGKVYGYNQPVSDKMELPNSWDRFLFDAGKWKTGWNAFFGYADGCNRQSKKGEVKPYESAPVGDDGYVDGLTADIAVKQISELKNSSSPFLLAVGFFKPHLPWNAPQKYWDLYDENTLPLSSAPNIPAFVNNGGLHNSDEFNQYKDGNEKPSLKNPVSDRYARKLRHAYYASVSYVDAQIGKVLDALKKNGLDKNTIIVLWGDHGWHLGDQRVWGKHTLSEYALKSAFILCTPGMKQSGKSTSGIVQSVDIYPTLLELAGIKQPYTLDGKSLVPLLTNPQSNTEGKAYGYFNNGITLRTNRYRITKYFRKQQSVIELYDYVNDPYETNNIAKDNPEIVNRLLPLLEEGNTGLYN